jgi:peroxiredoxin
MPTKRDLHSLPADLPVPKDDGACDHLTDMALPNLTLPATVGRARNLVSDTRKPTVLFFYPRTGLPDEPAPADWDQIPGARGCTPQSCGFRDEYKNFTKLGVQVFGVSTQSTAYQQEFATRNELPYPILSDENFALTNALRLPTFEFNGMRLIKRLALYIESCRIGKVFYPVFPPDQNAAMILAWLK